MPDEKLQWLRIVRCVTIVRRRPRQAPLAALTSRTSSLHFPQSTEQHTPPSSLPRVAMPGRLRSTLSRTLARPVASSGVFYCPSCATWRRALSTRTGTGIDKLDAPRRHTRQSDPLSHTPLRPFATSSAITAGKTVPPRFRELYDALSGVRDAAIEQVSVSRLQLALRGLESEAPLIRVAGASQISMSFVTGGRRY